MEKFTVLSYLDKLPLGSLVEDKRVLFLFKRLKFIYDYSQWGYLESQWVYYKSKDSEGVYKSKQFTYSGPEILPGNSGSIESPFLNFHEWCKSKFTTSLYFEYHGYVFAEKYVSGCFNAYLQLIKKPLPEAIRTNLVKPVFNPRDNTVNMNTNVLCQYPEEFNIPTTC